MTFFECLSCLPDACSAVVKHPWVSLLTVTILVVSMWLLSTAPVVQVRPAVETREPVKERRVVKIVKWLWERE